MVDGGMGGAALDVMNADGSGPMNVSQAMAIGMNDANPTWTSDGREIVFCSNRASNGKMHVYTVPMSGGEVRLMSGNDTEDCYPDFKPPRRGTR